jgi:hypothetical protein
MTSVESPKENGTHKSQGTGIKIQGVRACTILGVNVPVQKVFAKKFGL